MRRLALVLALAAALLGVARVAEAHELRPGFLELRETGPGAYSFLWKKPTQADVSPLFPQECRLSQPLSGAEVVRGTLTCEGGLGGKTLAIAGLELTVTDVVVRVHHADGRLESHVLKPVSPSVTLGAVTSAWQRSGAYVGLGLDHILLGADHLLFVLGLLLIVDDRWKLVRTITAFTVAHSLTLAAATLGVVRAPMLPLNAAIALSILFLGPEIVRKWRGETSFTIRNPWIVAFAFGLLHGFGFATGLSAMGLPHGEIPLALLLFNVGVEVGQVLFVLLILGLVRSFRTLEIAWPKPIQLLPGYLVGTLGAYWTIQRTLMLLWGSR